MHPGTMQPPLSGFVSSPGVSSLQVGNGDLEPSPHAGQEKSPGERSPLSLLLPLVMWLLPSDPASLEHPVSNVSNRKTYFPFS